MFEGMGVAKLFAKLWYAVLIIIMGAGVYATIEGKTAKAEGKPYGFKHFLAAMAIGGFSGTIFALGAGSFLNVEGGQLAFVGGVGAVLGLSGIKFLNGIFLAGIKARIGAISNDDNQKPR